MARHLARRLLELDHCLTSQWITGEANNLADLLSQDMIATDIELTNTIKHLYLSQIPASFQVCQLPTEVTLKLFLLVQQWLPTTASPKEQEVDTIFIGQDGQHSSTRQESTTNSWTATLNTTNHKSTQPLSKQSKSKHLTPFQRMVNLQERLAESTLPVWQRPLPCPEEMIQETVWTERF